jgi:hypothetical protein
MLRCKRKNRTNFPFFWIGFFWNEWLGWRKNGEVSLFPRMGLVMFAQSKNAKQSQLYKAKNGILRRQRGCQKKNRHRPVPFLRGPKRGVSNRGHNQTASRPQTLPEIDSCCTGTNRSPSFTLGAVMAPVGRQRSIGDASDVKLPSQSNNSTRVCDGNSFRQVCACKQTPTFFWRLVTGHCCLRCARATCSDSCRSILMYV